MAEGMANTPNTPEDLGEAYNPWKDRNYRWRAASLFVETNRGSELDQEFEPLFTLADGPHPSGKPSFIQLYLEFEDPTEYEFANCYLGGYEHLQYLSTKGSIRIRNVIAQARKELDLKLKAKYLRLLKETAETGEGNQALNAAKYLLENATSHEGGKTKRGRGRPSKQEKYEAAVDAARTDADIQADAQRLGLRRVK